MSKSAPVVARPPGDTGTEPIAHLSARWGRSSVTVETGGQPVIVQTGPAQPYTFHGHTVRHAQPGVPYSDRPAKLDINIGVAYADGTSDSWTEHADHGYFTYDVSILLRSGKAGVVTMTAVATDTADPDVRTPSITIKVTLRGI